MTAESRRLRAILLAGAAAILPALAFAQDAPAQVAPAPGLFIPPEAPMVLTRTLRRVLPGGAELVARRQYRVTFVHSGEGFLVDGTLINTEVTVPPMLEALAEIERKRPDVGMFPIRLDTNGQNISENGRAVPGASLSQAARVVSGEVDKVTAPGADRQIAQGFVRQVEVHSAGSQWPADLFHPQPGQRRESRAVALPGGDEGRVTIDISAEAAPLGGVLSRLERVVTTELGGTTRVTREEWTLTRPVEQVAAK